MLDRRPLRAEDHLRHAAAVGHDRLDPSGTRASKVFSSMPSSKAPEPIDRGPFGRHAAIDFTCLPSRSILAPDFGRAGEQAADHHARSPGRPAPRPRRRACARAVGNDRYTVRRAAPAQAITARSGSRHAYAGRYPRRARRAGPDADFHGVGPRGDQVFRSLDGGHVAGVDQFHVGEASASARTPPAKACSEWPCAMSTTARRLRGHQRLSALAIITDHSDGGAHAQPPARIPRRHQVLQDAQRVARLISPRSRPCPSISGSFSMRCSWSEPLGLFQRRTDRVR